MNPPVEEPTQGDPDGDGILAPMPDQAERASADGEALPSGRFGEADIAARKGHPPGILLRSRDRGGELESVGSAERVNAEQPLRPTP